MTKNDASAAARRKKPMKFAGRKIARRDELLDANNAPRKNGRTSALNATEFERKTVSAASQPRMSLSMKMKSADDVAQNGARRERTGHRG